MSGENNRMNLFFAFPTIFLFCYYDPQKLKKVKTGMSGNGHNNIR